MKKANPEPLQSVPISQKPIKESFGQHIFAQLFSILVYLTYAENGSVLTMYVLSSKTPGTCKVWSITQFHFFLALTNDPRTPMIFTSWDKQ